MGRHRVRQTVGNRPDRARRLRQAAANGKCVLCNSAAAKFAPNFYEMQQLNSNVVVVALHHRGDSETIRYKNCRMAH